MIKAPKGLFESDKKIVGEIPKDMKEDFSAFYNSSKELKNREVSLSDVAREVEGLEIDDGVDFGVLKDLGDTYIIFANKEGVVLLEKYISGDDAMDAYKSGDVRDVYYHPFNAEGLVENVYRCTECAAIEIAKPGKIVESCSSCKSKLVEKNDSRDFEAMMPSKDVDEDLTNTEGNTKGNFEQDDEDLKREQDLDDQLEDYRKTVNEDEDEVNLGNYKEKMADAKADYMTWHKDTEKYIARLEGLLDNPGDMPRETRIALDQQLKDYRQSLENGSTKEMKDFFKTMHDVNESADPSYVISKLEELGFPGLAISIGEDIDKTGFGLAMDDLAKAKAVSDDSPEVEVYQEVEKLLRNYYGKDINEADNSSFNVSDYEPTSYRDPVLLGFKDRKGKDLGNNWWAVHFDQSDGGLSSSDYSIVFKVSDDDKSIIKGKVVEPNNQSSQSAVFKSRRYAESGAGLNLNESNDTTMTIKAKGISDKMEADKMARSIQGSKVVTDAYDEDKFMVILTEQMNEADGDDPTFQAVLKELEANLDGMSIYAFKDAKAFIEWLDTLTRYDQADSGESILDYEDEINKAYDVIKAKSITPQDAQSGENYQKFAKNASEELKGKFDRMEDNNMHTENGGMVASFIQAFDLFDDAQFAEHEANKFLEVAEVSVPDKMYNDLTEATANKAEELLKKYIAKLPNKESVKDHPESIKLDGIENPLKWAADTLESWDSTYDIGDDYDLETEEGQENDPDIGYYTVYGKIANKLTKNEALTDEEMKEMVFGLNQSLYDILNGDEISI